MEDRKMNLATAVNRGILTSQKMAVSKKSMTNTDKGYENFPTGMPKDEDGPMIGRKVVLKG